jgi:hypothetical protein
VVSEHDLVSKYRWIAGIPTGHQPPCMASDVTSSTPLVAFPEEHGQNLRVLGREFVRRKDLLFSLPIQPTLRIKPLRGIAHRGLRSRSGRLTG